MAVSYHVLVILNSGFFQAESNRFQARNTKVRNVDHETVVKQIAAIFAAAIYRASTLTFSYFN